MRRETLAKPGELGSEEKGVSPAGMLAKAIPELVANQLVDLGRQAVGRLEPIIVIVVARRNSPHMS
eukprot:6823597-Prorocentrum_lima.AAC.1